MNIKFIHKSSYIFILAILFSFAAKAQNFRYYLSDFPRFVNSSSDTLPMPFVGGLNAPQFSKTDINNDGKTDLLVFDRSGNKLLPFINTGTQGNARYSYAPWFENYFPKLENWVLMVDYNGDGKEDIFTGYNGATVIYKNTSLPSNNFPSFELVTKNLRAYNFYPPPNDSTNIYVASFNIPAITDIDGDGDIDILTFPPGNGYVEYYKNHSVEFGLPKDSLAFRFVDFCWGNFAEHPVEHEVIMGASVCNFFPKYYKKHTGGSTLLALDMDEDGDMDLMLGNAFFNPLLMLKNGKKEFSTRYDSIVSFDSLYPNNTLRAKVTVFPAAYHLDIDGDGKRDLMVAPNAILETKEVNQVLYYKNEGTDLGPVFKFRQNDFLQEHMVDLGGRSAPVFWDFDGDGDHDLIVAATGDFDSAQNKQDRLILFENTGDVNRPVFKIKDHDFLKISTEYLSGIVPSFGDLNGDGKPDLVLGTAKGNLRYYINTTTGLSPTFELSDSAIGGIMVSGHAAPQIIDLDRDGLNDLVVGEMRGNINFFKNTGTTNSPAFVLEDDTLGNFVINEFRYDTNPPQYNFTGFAAPFVTDLDNDGKYEMLVGGEEGKVRVFTNIEGNLKGKFDEVQGYIYDVKSQTYTSSDFGNMAKPAAADLTGNNKKEIMIGNSRGGLHFISTSNWLDTSLGIGFSPVNKEPAIKLYPNPATTVLNIAREEAGAKFEISISNLVGQTLLKTSMDKDSFITDMDVSGLKQGVYFVNVFEGTIRVKSSKLVIIR